MPATKAMKAAPKGKRQETKAMKVEAKKAAPAMKKAKVEAAKPAKKDSKAAMKKETAKKGKTIEEQEDEDDMEVEEEEEPKDADEEAKEAIKLACAFGDVSENDSVTLNFIVDTVLAAPVEERTVYAETVLPLVETKLDAMTAHLDGQVTELKAAAGKLPEDLAAKTEEVAAAQAVVGAKEGAKTAKEGAMKVAEDAVEAKKKEIEAVDLDLDEKQKALNAATKDLDEIKAANTILGAIETVAEPFKAEIEAKQGQQKKALADKVIAGIVKKEQDRVFAALVKAAGEAEAETLCAQLKITFGKGLPAPKEVKKMVPKTREITVEKPVMVKKTKSVEKEVEEEQEQFDEAGMSTGFATVKVMKTVEEEEEVEEMQAVTETEEYEDEEITYEEVLRSRADLGAFVLAHEFMDAHIAAGEEDVTKLTNDIATVTGTKTGLEEQRGELSATFDAAEAEFETAETEFKAAVEEHFNLDIAQTDMENKIESIKDDIERAEGEVATHTASVINEYQRLKAKTNIVEDKKTANPSESASASASGTGVENVVVEENAMQVDEAPAAFAAPAEEEAAPAAEDAEMAEEEAAPVVEEAAPVVEEAAAPAPAAVEPIVWNAPAAPAQQWNQQDWQYGNGQW
jgi:hypothetical protein